MALNFEDNVPLVVDAQADTADAKLPEEISAIVPFGRFHYNTLLLCGFGWTCDNIWMTGLSFQRPQIVEEFGLGNVVSGVISSMLFAGLLVGAAVWGYLSDQKGRRFAFTATLLIASVSAVITAVMPLWPLIAITLFCVGFGAGGNLPVDGALFSEFIPSARRGFWMVVLAVFWPVGGVIAVGLAWITIPLLPVVYGWRVMMACMAIIAATIFVCRRGIPESARFYAVQGRTEEAVQVIETVCDFIIIASY